MKLRLKVYPGSSREKIVKEGGSIKAYVKAAPDKGKANKALIELIAKEYKVSKSKVVILTGLTSRNKLVEVLEG